VTRDNDDDDDDNNNNNMHMLFKTFILHSSGFNGTAGHYWQSLEH
jgi:hypothetical protein